MYKLFSFSIGLVLFTLILVSCGGESNKEDSGTAVRTIDVIGIDQLKFVVAEQAEGLQTGEEVTVNGQTYYVLEGITASAGEELTITLQNISDLPPQAMSHNWLLLTKDTDPETFNTTSMQAKDNDYVAPAMENQVIIDTGLVGKGETKSITFNVPEQTGKYDYLCTFPGHFTAGMRGTLTVE